MHFLSNVLLKSFCCLKQHENTFFFPVQGNLEINVYHDSWVCSFMLGFLCLFVLKGFVPFLKWNSVSSGLNYLSSNKRIHWENGLFFYGYRWL